MPAKKKATTETTSAVEEVKETAAKKTTKKTAAKKAVKETETAEKKTASKTTKAAKEEKTAEKKTAAKKPAAKKTTRKAAAKAEEVKAEEVKMEAVPAEVEKQTQQKYEDVINWKKGEAHALNWLYIEVSAGDLLQEVEAGVDNLDTCVAAMLNVMLEGDHYIIETENKVDPELRVRYYVDNLSESRRKYSEVNQ